MEKIPEIGFRKSRISKVEGFQFIELEKLVSGEYTPSDHNPCKPHRLGFYAVLIITEGEANHIVDFNIHSLQKGDVMVISSGQVHAFDEYSDCKGFIVYFSEAFMQKYIAQSTLSRINQLYNYFYRQEKINNPKINQHLLSLLETELESASSSLPNIIGSMLGIYLLKLNEENCDQTILLTENRSLDYFNEFRALVEKNFSKTRDAKEYASEISISYKHLNKICKDVVQNTAKSFIDRYVVLEAKRMLVSTSLSVKEISFELGFDEPTNFLKYFKKHTNLTPVEFRNTLA